MRKKIFRCNTRTFFNKRYSLNAVGHGDYYRKTEILVTLCENGSQQTDSHTSLYSLCVQQVG